MKEIVFVSLLSLWATPVPNSPADQQRQDTAAIKKGVANNLRQIDSLNHEININRDLLDYRDNLNKNIEP